MKKQLLLLTGIAAVTGATAQVTLTQADLPAPFTVVHIANDTTMTQSPGNGGPSQTYAFSSLLNQGEDSLTFTLPQFTPYGQMYPMSNMAEILNLGDAFIYATVTPTELLINGQAFDPLGTGIVPLTYMNPETQMIFPAAYGSSFADTATGFAQFFLGIDPGIGFVIDSVRVHSWVSKNSEYDGWGSCQTPLNTFNVLRQNTFRKQIDTIDIFAFGAWAPNFFSQVDSSRKFTYWANSIGFPVVELTDQDDLGQITDATWLAIMPTVTGIPVSDIPAGTVSAYPNPATDILTFETPSSEGSIEIVDLSGRVVKVVAVTSTTTRVDVSDLASGMYTYRLNGQAAAGKVQIAH